MEINPKAFEAFAKAQASFRSAIKDAKNPFFKSVYADLPAIWEAVKESLSANDLFVTQPIGISETGFTIVKTIVRYKDGTIIEESECPVICKVEKDPQAMGSAITYARRYSLASILCVVTDDDDGNSAAAAPQAAKHAPATPPPTPVANGPSPIDKWVTDIDKLPKDVARWNAHMTALKSIGGGKGEFDKLKLKAATVGFYFDTDKKVFTTMESFKQSA